VLVLHARPEAALIARLSRSLAITARGNVALRKEIIPSANLPQSSLRYALSVRKLWNSRAVVICSSNVAASAK
jgi:hypothetical protein